MNTLPAVHTPMVLGGTAHGTLATMFGGGIPPYVEGTLVELEPIRRGEPLYRAVAKKRIAWITADEFLQLAYRFIMICGEEYGTYRVECFKNWCEGVDTPDSYSPEKLVTLKEQTPETFRAIFRSCRAMRICVSPTVVDDNNRHSFTLIEWDINRPRSLEFYGQAGGISREHGNSLCDRLKEKMFPRRYPTWNWVAKIGVDAVLRERYGW